MSRKKVFSALALFVALLLSSCGKDPIASGKALMNGNKALEVAEGYIAGEISGDDAYSQLKDIADSMKYASEYTYEETHEDERKYADYQISFAASMIAADVLNDKGMFGNAETFDRVKEATEKLRKLIKEYD